MESGAARRISRRAPKKAPGRDRGMPEGRSRPFFPLVILLSLLIHASVLGLLIYLPGGAARKNVTMYSVELVPLPGPKGGGGESARALKPPMKPARKPPQEKKPVTVVEKKTAPETKKRPREQPLAKVPEAPKGPGQGPVGGGGKKGMTRGPITLEGGVAFPFGYYLDAIQRKVEGNWEPPNLWNMKTMPTVTVFFNIDRRGGVSGVDVEKSSGIDLFDQKAVVAVKRSAPFPPLPDDFKGDRLGVHYLFIPVE